MKRAGSQLAWLVLLGFGSLAAYGYAWTLVPIREFIPEFSLAFFAAFILYAFAIWVILRASSPAGGAELWIIIGFAAVFSAILAFTRPSLSDDMYRYVWDGRVQAQGISPYRYSPLAARLLDLRDEEIWPMINRKSAVTVYPPAAELAFGILWRIRPDNVRWFQVFTAGAGMLAGVLLVGLLRDLGRPPARVLVYLWSPLLIYETAHSAHLDGLVLPLIVGAFWARVRERDGWAGLLLGLAAGLKFYPAILFPALWRPNHRTGRWLMPLAFAGVLAASYLPALAADGLKVLGFLPDYLGERFNISPLVGWLLVNLPHQDLSESQQIIQWMMLAFLALAGLVMVVRPARDPESALIRCLPLIAIYILFNPNLFSWYLLWLLPLLAIFLEPGRLRIAGRSLPIGLRLDAWTGFWLFTGLSALSYTFFIDWDTIPLAISLQFWPLYIFLGIDLFRRLRPRSPDPSALVEMGLDNRTVQG